MFGAFPGKRRWKTKTRKGARNDYGGRFVDRCRASSRRVMDRFSDVRARFQDIALISVCWLSFFFPSAVAIRRSGKQTGTFIGVDCVWWCTCRKWRGLTTRVLVLVTYMPGASTSPLSNRALSWLPYRFATPGKEGQLVVRHMTRNPQTAGDKK